MSLTPSLAPLSTAGSSAPQRVKVVNQSHDCAIFIIDITQPSSTDLLPDDWRRALDGRLGDQQWMGKALFVSKNKIHDTAAATLWWHPPTPSASTKPNPDMYVLRRLFLWMPRRAWEVDFKCPCCPDCSLQ